MIFKKTIFFFFVCVTFIGFSQDENYAVSLIPSELKENANAVIRDYNVTVDLHNYNDMTINSKRVITVLNENGLRHVDAYVLYDPAIRIKSVLATIYNSNGEEIKKVRKKDFKDYSNSGNELFSDNRVLALNYTPTDYPFTIVFNYVTQTGTTAFIPRWYPIDNYYVSVEKSSFKINNESNIDLRVRELNINTEGIDNKSEGNVVFYNANNLRALKRESMSPEISKLVPAVKVASSKFQLVNVDGYAKNWNEFGKWNYTNLLKGRDDLSANTIQKVTNLVQGISDPLEKAKIIYQFVQNNTRYISVQLGVGGWQPILASKVDKVSYGDCKALTNYTMALMESQGIEANYTVVYGDNDIRDIEEDFVAMQGNHVILNLPNDGNPVWLECTSQKVPFGFIANFTDDRDVLVITENGGKIEHTKTYSNKENYLKTKANISINSEGLLSAEIESKSGGTQYDSKLDITDLDSKDRKVHYKQYWDYVNDISIENINLDNNRDAIEITEKVKLKASNYMVKAGDKLLVNPNVFNRITNVPPRYTNRKLPFIIQRGFLDNDVYEITLPEGYRVEALPDSKEIKTKYGIYTSSLELIEDSKIIYSRTLEMNKGDFPKEEYKAYRSFRRKIAKADKASFVLVKR